MLERLSRWVGRLVLRATGRAADLRLDGDAKLVLAPRIHGHFQANGHEKSNVVRVEDLLAERARRRADRRIVRRFEGPQAKF